jgi:hypothetical protein
MLRPPRRDGAHSALRLCAAEPLRCSAARPEATMTLPFDFGTTLWFVSVPVYEWLPDPAPPGDGGTAPAPDAAGEAGVDASAAGAVPTTTADAATAAVASPPAAHTVIPAMPDVLPDPSPDDGRAGFRRVFKGWTIEGQLCWFPLDSPLSRPWLHNRLDDDDDDRRYRARGSDAAQPAPPDDDATRAKRNDGTA